MKKLMATLTAVVCLLVPLQISYGQQAEPPTYKDGDWWKVKTEITHSGAFQRSGRCEEMYAEYLVKVDGGKPKVYGLKGSAQEDLDCPPIESQLLDKGKEVREWLKFPLRVGNTWTFRYQRKGPTSGRAQWVTAESSVRSLEKVTTPKGEFDAFKIVRWIEGTLTETCFYSPAAKAIVVFDRNTPVVSRLVTLVDFSLSP